MCHLKLKLVVLEVPSYYGKDIPCPESWEGWLRSNLPSHFHPCGENDMISCLPPKVYESFICLEFRLTSRTGSNRNFNVLHGYWRHVYAGAQGFVRFLRAQFDVSHHGRRFGPLVHVCYRPVAQGRTCSLLSRQTGRRTRP